MQVGIISDDSYQQRKRHYQLDEFTQQKSIRERCPRAELQEFQMQGKQKIGKNAHCAAYSRRHSPPCSNHKPHNDCRCYCYRNLQEYSPKHCKHIIMMPVAPDSGDPHAAEAVFYDGATKTQIYGKPQNTPPLLSRKTSRIAH